jgi:maleylacetate reductase
LDPFVYKSLPLRVVFGEGTSARLAEEAELLAIRRALVLTTPGHKRLGREMAEQLGDRFAALFAGAVMHTPVGVTEDAVKRAREAKADGVVAVGAGSTVGLGKAISLRTGLPQIAVPTTYAGSEMTPILGETKDGVDDSIDPRDIAEDRNLRRRTDVVAADSNCRGLRNERAGPLSRGSLRQGPQSDHLADGD